MEKKKIKIGVIGCGYWGPNLIRNFNNIGKADMFYVCDIDETKISSIKNNYPKVKTTKDYKEILTNPDVDAIAIALPVFLHYQVAKESLLHNKHVLVEKPMTANSEQARELIEIAKEKNKILMVDHTFEYSEPIKKVKEIVDSGELGDIYYIRAEWLNLGLLQPDIDVIWDLAPHMISIINYITGLKPESITAHAKGYIRKDIPEIAQVNIDFEKGVSAYFTTGWLEPKKTRTVTIVGSKKLLVFDLINKEESVKVYDKSVEMVKEDDLRNAKMYYKYGDTLSPNIKDVESLNTMCRHFIDCIKYNKKPKSDGESGLNVVKILEKIEDSIKTHDKTTII